MTSWQKRIRIGLAIFGLVFSVIVYRSMGERRAPPSATPVKRIDPKATSETEDAELRRLRQTSEAFAIKSKRSLTYEDGSIKFFDVEITHQKADGRVYVVTTAEAQGAGQNQKEKQLTGQVVLHVSDGFELKTDRATHNEDQGLVRAPGAVAFSKGGMTGSGADATYDQMKDILTIAQNAKVAIADQSGKVTTDFSSGGAVLDRTQNTLVLDRQAHVLRSEQVIDADHVTTRLSDDEQIVTYIELRGNSRVKGGASIDSMSARDIDLDYTDDGQALERVMLVGTADISMKTAQGSGRHISGESIEVRLAPDGSILAVTGRDKVRLDLPSSGESRGGSITAAALDGTGEEGHGLTSAQFHGDVEYREPQQGSGAAGRVVRSQDLKASLADDAVADAVFTGKVTFNDEGVVARAAEVRYQPGKNTLSLRGSDGGVPHAELDQIAIDARTIDVALEDHSVRAVDVKTTLRPRSPSKGAAGSRGQETGVALPGLLRQNEPANINADGLDYRGKSGQAVYTGMAALWQGETAIRGDIISLDQEKGSLVATGSARSTLELDTGRSAGRGQEIRYDDMKRVVTYSGAGLPPTIGRGSAPATTRGAAPTAGRGAVPVRDAQLSGPQGDLNADRIEIVLAQEGNQVERLEAYTNVRLKLDTRNGVGNRLTYHAMDERYVMTGTSAAPVKITSVASETTTGAKTCRETTGRTLTFYKSTDTINVDGNEATRTQTQTVPCTLPSSR